MPTPSFLPRAFGSPGDDDGGDDDDGGGSGIVADRDVAEGMPVGRRMASVVASLQVVMATVKLLHPHGR